MYAQNGAQFMADEDLLTMILDDLKRTVREYTTAATESNCQTVRRVFNDLTMDTLRIQGDLYNQMSQMGFYQAPDKALRQAVDKQIQSAQQIQQKSQHFVQQKLNGTGDYRQAPNVSQHQPNVQSSYYM
ncbi:coat protein F [Paenibacillus helianthi]|uniref:Coat protein F n=1 Tax=Paenibacillus helianthi TaxID=1349432 RepID=A0ABX3EU77_9BACL|nr:MULTISPECIES: spore coat protein [Paenibacillus]OKP72675.1 coat protein F [Paenibacillus sp. P3E]OKP88872.1 coat protein F [Paenibacillus helianthi]OKP92191.1 coat protein F [Paenibacillus sp. P32E]